MGVSFVNGEACLLCDQNTKPSSYREDTILFFHPPLGKMTRLYFAFVPPFSNESTLNTDCLILDGNLLSVKFSRMRSVADALVTEQNDSRVKPICEYIFP